MPLGKGRGSAGVAAQERASVFTLRAREEQARQIATEEVYRTLLAYIRLIAAQENLKLAQALVASGRRRWSGSSTSASAAAKRPASRASAPRRARPSSSRRWPARRPSSSTRA